MRETSMVKKVTWEKRIRSGKELNMDYHFGLVQARGHGRRSTSGRMAITFGMQTDLSAANATDSARWLEKPGHAGLRYWSSGGRFRKNERSGRYQEDSDRRID